jgi:UDP-N-acetylglucosamine 2-epimerase (non-hydrolysing)
VFGTRPEAIKLCPLIEAFQQYPAQAAVKVCVSAQHRTLLDHVLTLFNVAPAYDLNLMQPGQTLFQTTEAILREMHGVLAQERPDWVIVQGDTTTAFVAALAAFYQRVPGAHVEAGLRTHDIYAPFPEEVNRRLVSVMATLHFAATAAAQQNLLREGVAAERIFVTGNTVIDALLRMRAQLRRAPELLDPARDPELRKIDFTKRIILVTGHRRESFGPGFLQICQGLARLAATYPAVEIVYPVHLNPNVRQPVFALLGAISNIKLLEPLAYLPFVWLMEKSYLIITDSGGIQEEAPALGKPVLVMRDITERPEAIAAGAAQLVGTDPAKIAAACARLLDDPQAYRQMATTVNPYGDGTACAQIVKIMLNRKDAKTRRKEC